MTCAASATKITFEAGSEALNALKATQSLPLSAFGGIWWRPEVCCCFKSLVQKQKLIIHNDTVMITWLIIEPFLVHELFGS